MRGVRKDAVMELCVPMKLFFQSLLWINLSLAVLCGVVFSRDVLYANHQSAGKSLIAVGIWLGFALFCYCQIRRIKREAEEMLEELEKLGFEQALQKARASSVCLPHGLVASKVNYLADDWYAFERNSIQFVVAKCHDSGRAKVKMLS